MSEPRIIIGYHTDDQFGSSMEVPVEDVFIRTNGIEVPSKHYMARGYAEGMLLLAWNTVKFVYCSDPDYDIGW